MSMEDADGVSSPKEERLMEKTQRNLSLIVNDQVIDSIPTTLTDDEAIELDTLLRNNGLLKDNQEIATTETV